MRIWAALPLWVLPLPSDCSPDHDDNHHDSKEDEPFDNDKSSYDLRRHHHSPSSPRDVTRFPYTTLFRSPLQDHATRQVTAFCDARAVDGIQFDRLHC